MGAAGVASKRYGGMETGCNRADVTTKRYEARELGRQAASGGAKEVCRSGAREAW